MLPQARQVNSFNSLVPDPSFCSGHRANGARPARLLRRKLWTGDRWWALQGRVAPARALPFQDVFGPAGMNPARQNVRIGILVRHVIDPADSPDWSYSA